MREGQLNISVFHFAGGEPVVFPEWKWLVEKDRVVGVGKWMAQLHDLTRQFVKEHPGSAFFFFGWFGASFFLNLTVCSDLYANARDWTELHDGILAEAPVDPLDKQSVFWTQKFSASLMVMCVAKQVFELLLHFLT